MTESYKLRVSVLGHFQQPFTDVQSLIDSSLCVNDLALWEYISTYYVLQYYIITYYSTHYIILLYVLQ